MNLLRKIKCWMGWCDEYDIWIASFYPEVIEHINIEKAKGWGWIKVPYDKFGSGFYCECKHCGRRL